MLKVSIGSLGSKCVRIVKRNLIKIIDRNFRIIKNYFFRKREQKQDGDKT